MFDFAEQSFYTVYYIREKPITAPEIFHAWDREKRHLSEPLVRTQIAYEDISMQQHTLQIAKSISQVFTRRSFDVLRRFAFLQIAACASGNIVARLVKWIAIEIAIHEVPRESLPEDTP